jgi:hypothetical protein
VEVFIHVGGGKTGTSAIQAAFAAHRDALLAAGLAYPAGPEQSDRAAVRGEVTSGNGRELAWLVSPASRPAWFSAAETEARIDQGLAWAAGRLVLFSSESLQGLGPAEIEALAALFRRRGAAIRILYYARHLLDQAVARFCQRAKVGRLATGRAEERTLDGWISHYDSPTHLHLGNFADVLGHDRVVCRLFDHERQDLIGSVLEAVAPGKGLAGVLAPAARDKVVNRSPTPIELDLLIALHAEPDARLLCRAVADALFNQPPAVAAALHVGAAAHAAFAARNAAGIDVVNRRFLPPATPLRLDSGRVPIGPPPPRSEAGTAAALAAVVAAMARHRAPSPPPDAAERQAARREARQRDRQRDRAARIATR